MDDENRSLRPDLDDDSTKPIMTPRRDVCVNTFQRFTEAFLELLGLERLCVANSYLMTPHEIAFGFTHKVHMNDYRIITSMKTAELYLSNHFGKIRDALLDGPLVSDEMKRLQRIIDTKDGTIQGLELKLKDLERYKIHYDLQRGITNQLPGQCDAVKDEDCSKCNPK